MKGAILAVIIGVIALVLFVVLFFFGSALGVAERTFDADNVIYSYEHFFDLKANADMYCNQIDQFQAELESMRESLPEDRAEWSAEDRNDLRRQETELTGIKAQRYRIVEQYNAESDKANVSIFQDNDLPDQLNEEC